MTACVGMTRSPFWPAGQQGQKNGVWETVIARNGNGQESTRLDVLFRHANGDGLGSDKLAANRTVFGYVFAYSSRGLRLPTLRRD